MKPVLFATAASAAALFTGSALAQAHQHAPAAPPQATAQPAPADPHAGHRMPQNAAAQPAQATVDPHAGHDMSQAGQGASNPHAGHDMGHRSADPHAGHDMSAMPGLLGSYSMSRESSGTSWQPELSPHDGVHAQAGGWDLMGHVNLFGVAIDQGGRRGDSKAFVAGMVMGRASRPFAGGTLALRGMVSPDPFMGRRGYPLLLATGETADGEEPLIDRQHPHELIVELAASYSLPIGANSSVFLYGGPVAEPAFGPTTFMHRGSGLDNPEAPISHHWFDSTHITFGVLTAGVTSGPFKLEASSFRGREPDEDRFDIERPKLDSQALRAAWNPSAEWSFQASAARLNSPEQLEPDVDDTRVSLSAAHTRRVFANGLWSTTAAYGRKDKSPGPALNAWLLESALRLDERWTVFARAEAVEQDELLGHHGDDDHHGDEGEEASPIFDVGKVSLGAVRDFRLAPRVKFGIGAAVSAFRIPDALEPEYGDASGALAFVRLKVE